MTYLFPNFYGEIIDVLEKKSNFNPHFIDYMITYKYRNY